MAAPVPAPARAVCPGVSQELSVSADNKGTTIIGIEIFIMRIRVEKKVGKRERPERRDF
jgi:hypothetical protein